MRRSIMFAIGILIGITLFLWLAGCQSVLGAAEGLRKDLHNATVPNMGMLGERDPELIEAIWEVETGKRKGPIWGDDGRSFGPLQISEAAWKDSLVIGEWKDCASIDYATLVFWRYTDRWCSDDATREDRARCWNSGPKWRGKKELTEKYWKRVEDLL